MAAGSLRSLAVALALVAGACSTQSTPDTVAQAPPAPSAEAGTIIDVDEPASIYQGFSERSTVALQAAFGWDLTVAPNVGRRSLVVELPSIEQGGSNVAIAIAETQALQTMAVDLNRLLSDEGHRDFLVTHVIVESPKGIWPCSINDLAPPYACIADPVAGGDPQPLPATVD